ncbi:MAG TPA: hypothetical protein VGK94_07965 [Candidatus Polarisedimenticolia bacterium]|jgi:hypothetical protein
MEYRALLLGPGGIEFDVTDRLGEKGLGKIKGATEENFLELTHGEVSLELADEDGAVSQFFSGVSSSDLYEVILERFTGARRNRWERIFGGILDLPWSIRIDHRARSINLQAFSYSKLLERASADTIKRSLDGLTGSVTATSKVVTISDTANIFAGDRIRLRDNTNDEEQTVAKVLTGTTVQTIDAWDNTFAALTPLTVETPYYRDKGLQFLADALFAAAGIASRAISILNPLALFPVATPMNTTTYPRDVDTGIVVDPRSFTQRGANIDVRMTDDGPTDRRAETPGPAEAWTSFTTGALRTINDWTPYLDAEPANFPDNGSFLLDDGLQHASDHTANLLYDLREGGTKFDLYSLVVGGGGIGGSTLLIEAFSTVTANQCHAGIDVDPVTGDVWMSCTGKTGDAGDKDSVKVWDGAVLTSIETAFSGQVRYLRRLKLVAVHEYDPGASHGNNPKETMRLYDAATRTLVKTIAVPQNFWAWSLRVWAVEEGIRIAGLYTLLGTTRLRIWDASWVQVADYQVADKASGIAGTKAFLSVFTDSGGKEFLVGCAGEQFFVVAKGYAGVIPYADFAGMSCAEGLRELAIASISYIEVDHFKAGTIRGRASRDEEARSQAIAIDEPLERVSWPISEFYRTSATITGSDSAGGKIEETAGDLGDSAHRLELGGELIQTGGLAEAIAQEYVSVLSVPRRQEELTFAETGRLVDAGDYLDFDGALWKVLDADLDTRARRITARVLED